MERRGDERGVGDRMEMMERRREEERGVGDRMERRERGNGGGREEREASVVWRWCTIVETKRGVKRRKRKRKTQEMGDTQVVVVSPGVLCVEKGERVEKE